MNTKHGKPRVGFAAALGFALMIALLTIVSTSAASPQTRRDDGQQEGQHGNEPPAAIHHDVSPALRDIAPILDTSTQNKERFEPAASTPVPAAGGTDPVVQSTPTAAAAPALGIGFDGVGRGFTGPAGPFTVNSAPPDTNGAVGPNHYVQIVNSSFAVFNKSGTALYGPAQTNTLFSGFGGGCQTNNDGDATVAYDRLADRWIISQFSVTTTPFLQCVAVSTTPDPTGSYYRYSFQYTNFPDYPKLGVWGDGYYTSFNMFNAAGTRFLGPEVCAYDRAKMLLGQAATQQCFTLSTTYGGLLPSDLDGATAPPAGSPNYILSFGTNILRLWKFHVDWTTPASSTFTGPTNISVAAFSPACSGGGTCIPQSGTTQKLDSLADRLMYRLAYRNFGDHESLVINHSVTAGSSVGVRWYELRSPGTTWTVFQQGTYAPDAAYRWMGSIAMDHVGNIGLGFSTSSSTTHPGIHYTGRLAGDPLGVMAQGEGVMIDGPGSQTGSSLSRWGDYSSMSVDPVDDCTFWYTTEYLKANGAFNWSTRIGSFKLAGCTSGPSDFSISASPSSLSVQQGASGTSTISTAVTLGGSQTVTLSAAGQPAGSTVSFNPSSVNTGASSTMTVNVGASTSPGSYTITVTGTGTATHTTSVALTVTAAPAFDFALTANPSSVSIQQGGSGTSTIGTAVLSGIAQTVTFSASGQPAGTTVSFNPGSVTAGGSSTMTVNVGSTATGSYAIVVTGTATGATHAVSVTLTVTAPPANPVVNGGFETGSFTPWTTAGAFLPVIATTTPHTGVYDSRNGSTSPFNGNSTLTQTVAVPAGSPRLTFWYQPHCTDTITYDQIQMQIRSTSGTTLATVLNVCSNSGVWTQVSYSMTAYANQTVVLWFNDHDDNWPGDPTYFLLDDVSVN